VGQFPIDRDDEIELALGAASNCRDQTARATRLQMESQPTPLSFPRTRKSIVSSTAYARFRGHDKQAASWRSVALDAWALFGRHLANLAAG
jgi:hypothetical protein